MLWIVDRKLNSQEFVDRYVWLYGERGRVLETQLSSEQQLALHHLLLEYRQACRDIQYGAQFWTVQDMYGLSLHRNGQVQLAIQLEKHAYANLGNRCYWK